MRRAWVLSLLVAIACSTSGPVFEVALESCSSRRATGLATNTGDSLASMRVVIAWYDEEDLLATTNTSPWRDVPGGATARWWADNFSAVAEEALGGERTSIARCEIAEVETGQPR